MKKILIASCLCGMLFANIACDSYDDIFPQKYEKILSLKTSGEQDLTLYKTGDVTDYSITLIKAGSKPTLTANAKIDRMGDSEFQKYISERGLNYVALPADCYSFNMTDLDFSSEETYKIIKLSINTDRVDEIMQNASPNQEYVLPIAVTSQTDSILAEKDYLILKPAVITPTLSFKGTTTTGTLTKYVDQTGGTISIPIGLQIDNQWDFSCKVAIDETTTTLDNFEIVNDKIDFTKGNNGAVQIRVSAMSHISGVIGLKISEIIGKDGFDIDATPLKLTISINKYPLKESMLSSNATEPSEGSLANLLDGDVGTYFHSAWSVSIAEDHYVQVTLPTALSKVCSFSYTNRQANGNAALAWFDLYVGADENSLKLYKKYDWEKDGLPGGGAEVYTSPEITLDTPVKVLRFVSKGNWTGEKFFVWSEFSLFGF